MSQSIFAVVIEPVIVLIDRRIGAVCPLIFGAREEVPRG